MVEAAEENPWVIYASKTYEYNSSGFYRHGITFVAPATTNEFTPWIFEGYFGNCEWDTNNPGYYQKISAAKYTIDLNKYNYKFVLQTEGEGTQNGTYRNKLRRWIQLGSRDYVYSDGNGQLNWERSHSKEWYISKNSMMLDTSIWQGQHDDRRVLYYALIINEDNISYAPVTIKIYRQSLNNEPIINIVKPTPNSP